MPTLARTFNWGHAISDLSPDLFRQLSKAYGDTSGIINTKVSKLVLESSDPPASDQVNMNYDIGDIAVRKDTNKVWVMTNRTSSVAVTWTLVS